MRRGHVVGCGLVALALTLAPTAHGDQVERVDNGGFELGATPWSYSNSTRCTSGCGFDPATGVYYGTLGPVTGDVILPGTTRKDLGTISQPISLPEGPANLSLSVRRVENEPPSGPTDTYLDVYYDGVLVRTFENGDLVTGSFQQSSTPIPAGFASSGTLAFETWCYNNDGATHDCARYDIDDVSVVTGLPSTPQPPGGAPAPPAPETSVIKRPKKRTTKRKARFAFGSDQSGASFECRLDKQAFRPCVSPKRVKVRRGKHRFAVRAISPAGVVDPTPATYSWKRKRAR